jgi:ABC-2 type transport system permease protein
MNAVIVLCHRELLRFVRQPVRVVGSLAQPLLFWLFMGSGFSGSFSVASGNQTYGEFFYPGIILMLLLFAAIFSTITLIEDRAAGFLQGVLVAPVSRTGVVMGKMLGGSAIALIQAVIFLAFAPFAGIALTPIIVIDLLVIFIIVALGFTGMGFFVAWRMDSTAGYHAVMSVVFIPMWLLSGALFPLDGSAVWLGWVMQFNPVTYAMTAIRIAFYEPLGMLVENGVFLKAIGLSAAWTTAMIVASVVAARRRNGV